MDTIEIIRKNVEKAVADGDTRSLQIWLNAYTALAKETEKLDVQKEKNDIQKERNKIDEVKSDKEYQAKLKELESSKTIQDEKNKIEAERIDKEYQIKTLESNNNKEIELNKLGLEQRKFEAEQKMEKFNKGVTIAEKVIGFIQAVADVGNGIISPIVNLKTAKINADQKKLCTKMITEIEKEGEIPYQQATKHHTW